MRLAVAFLLTVAFGCSRAAERPSPQTTTRLDLSRPPPLRQLASGEVPPPKPEELTAELTAATEEWFYGRGVGQTIANVGAIVVFPPYALYLLGNGALQLAGYGPLYMTDALPEEPRREMLKAVDEALQVPGRINAMVAGEKFRGE